MKLKLHNDLKSILKQAKCISNQTNTQINSTHLLLAIFTVPNLAQNILEKHGVEQTHILQKVKDNLDESKDIISGLLDAMEKYAIRCQTNTITSLHLLMGLINCNKCNAFAIINEYICNLKEILENNYILKTTNSNTDDFKLDNKKFYWLNTLGVNLTSLACMGKIDPVFYRNSELMLLVDILGKRRFNSPCLVGENGVGKSAIVEGLAFKIANRDKEVKSLWNKTIIEIDTDALFSNNTTIKSVPKKIQSLKREIVSTNGRVVVFIKSHIDLILKLKSVLSRNNIPCISTSTPQDFQQFISNNPSLERMLVKVQINKQYINNNYQIINKLSSEYIKYHNVNIEEKTIQTCIKLANKYISSGKLMQKALDILDLSMSKASRQNKTSIFPQDIILTFLELSRSRNNKLMLE